MDPLFPLTPQNIPVKNRLVNLFKRGMFVVFVLSLFCGSCLAEASMNRNYSYISFEHGYPMRLSWPGNSNARENPNLIIQTGYYSLRLECKTMDLSGYDALAGSDYVSALTEDVSEFSEADLSLYAYVGETRYECTSAIVQDSSDRMYVRLVESGQYVQRFDHNGLVFTDSEGNELSATGRLEVTAWADHVTFKLDFSESPNVTRTTVRIMSPLGAEHFADEPSSVARLSLLPHTDTAYSSLAVSDYISSATEASSGTALTTEYDVDEQALKVTVPAGSVRYPGDEDRLDEYLVTVHNPTDRELNVPLIFDPVSARAVTGTVMLLCETDGSPSGIPVQISKNWHTTVDTVHKGTWLRGYTMIPLAAGESKSFKLRVVYGYWSGGTVAAASHSFLSIVGWNQRANWKWDESALGAWGEALTYDPTRHAGRANMADVRPVFTTSMNGGEHGWTENVGGGNFLLYYDSAGTFRFNKLMKTCYKWSGPNITEVLYSGITDDGKVRFVNTVRGVASLDYHRKFNKFRYEFLQDVDEPSRLLFFQMGADGYNGPELTHYYHGTGGGLSSTTAADPDGNQYKGDPVLFTDNWLATNDTTAWRNPDNYAFRGFLGLSSSLNGEPFDLYMHPYGLGGSSPRQLFDLSSNSVSRSYTAGDVVEGELEFIMPAKNAASYWGGDSEFSGRLQAYGNEWNAVYDEYRYNRDLDVSLTVGTMMENYPLEIASNVGEVLADFTVNSGGLGHIPVVLRNVSKDAVIGVQRFVDGEWQWYDDGSFSERNYYQGFYNTSGSLDCAFSFKRPTSDLSESWRIRILGNAVGPVVDHGDIGGTYDAWDNSASSGSSLETGNAGFTGAGYIDMGGVDTWFEWDQIAGGNGGEAIFDFYYASATDREVAFTLNGESVGSVVFEATAGWNDWQSKTVELTLASGANRIRVTASTAAGGPNVDRVIVTAGDSLGVKRFYAWTDLYNLEGAAAETTADPDLDGWDNLTEYALGGHPNFAEDLVHSPEFRLDGNRLEYSYRRRVDAAERGLAYTVSSTRDLKNGTWESGLFSETSFEAIDDDFEHVTNDTGSENIDSVYVRLKIALGE